MDLILQYWPFVAVLFVFYFMIIRPQSQRRKAEKQFAESLKVGDRVITTSGIHGKVAQMNESSGTVVVETGAGKVTFERSAISQELTSKLSESTLKA
jgi:preprotein translocase subunit YajC